MLLTFPVQIVPWPQLILVIFFVTLLTLIVYLYETLIKKNDEWSWIAFLILLAVLLLTAGWYMKVTHDDVHIKEPIIIARMNEH